MKEIQAQVTFDENQFEDFKNEVISDCKDSMIDEIKDQIFDDIKSEVIDEIFDRSDEIVRKVEESLDIESYIDDIDFSSRISDDVINIIEDQLGTYTPKNPCGLGTSFLEAVHETFVYLLREDKTLAKLIREQIKESEIKELIDIEKSKIIDEARPGIIEEYKRNLIASIKEPPNDEFQQAVNAFPFA